MKHSITRRDFVKTPAALAAAAGWAEWTGAAPAASAPGPASSANAGASAPIEWRNRRPGMRYRQLGRTGFMISEIVCGGDPISPDNYKHVIAAFEMGLNYFDTAPAYGGGRSEEGYALALHAVGRDHVFLTTKIDPFKESRFSAYLKVYETLSAAEQCQILRDTNADIAARGVTLPSYFGHYDSGQYRQAEMAAIAGVMERKYGSKINRQKVYVDTILTSIEGSLRRLKTDHVDVMMCPHGAASPAEVRIPEIYEAFDKLKRQGKVRYLGVSAHNDPAHVLKAAAENGVHSMAMFAYNIMNREYVEPAIADAHARNFGMIAMKTSQAVFYPDRSTRPVPERAALLNQTVPGNLGVHQKAYRLALSNPHLSAVISNMVNEQQVRENLHVAMRA
ncbi:MAG: aldo/keto reductase [Terriglobia bacterium]